MTTTAQELIDVLKAMKPEDLASLTDAELRDVELQLHKWTGEIGEEYTRRGRLQTAEDDLDPDDEEFDDNA